MYLPVNMEVQMYIVFNSCIEDVKNITDQKIQMYIQTIADIEVVYCSAHHWSIPNIFLSMTYVFSSAVPSGSGVFQMPARPSSSSAASTLRGGGKCQSQKRFSNFFSFLAWVIF